MLQEQHEQKKASANAKERKMTTLTQLCSQSYLDLVLSFDWKAQCFFCCRQYLDDNSHPDWNDVRHIETIKIRRNVLKICEERLSVDNDSAYIFGLQGRLLTCCDLVAEEAVYHKNCYSELIKGIESLTVVEQSSVFAIDVGYLLQRVKWQKGSSYADIGEQYVNFICKNYDRYCA